MTVHRGAYLSLSQFRDEVLSCSGPLAFSFSGGGAAGAYESGVLEALLEHGLSPEILIGTSAGALNAFGELAGRLDLPSGMIPRTSKTFALDVWRWIDRGGKGAEHVLKPVSLWKEFQSAFKEGIGVWGGLLILWNRPWRKPSLLSIDPLIETLSRAVLDPAGAPDASLLSQTAGRKIHTAWRAQKNAPEFIVTATDITLKTETLFTLVRPETYARLVLGGWMTVQCVADQEDQDRYTAALEKAAEKQGLRVPEGLACTFPPEHLMHAVIASASIPGGFPPQRIPFFCRREDRTILAVHDFVDGGVVNNAPVHAAVDAGAACALSIELGRLARRHPVEVEAVKEKEEGVSAVQALLRSLMTAKELSTQNDIWGASRINRQIAEDQREGRSAKKRFIAIHRHAPAPSSAWAIDFLDFNGRFNKKGERTVSLAEWAEYGRRRALGDKAARWGDFASNPPEPERSCFDGKFLTDDGPFWRATLEPYPPSPDENKN